MNSKAYSHFTMLEKHGTNSFPLSALKIPFFRLGAWKHPKYGNIVGDQAAFDSIQKNFRDNVLGRPIFVRLGHDKDGNPTFGTAPAEAWVKDIRQDGDTLYAIAEPTKPQITDDVRNKRYRFSSAEYDPHFINKETGKDVGPTLTAIGLTNEPFLTQLQENVVLADQPDQIYLDYKEVQKMSEKNLLQENNILLTKMVDSFNKFFESVKPLATGGLTDNERAMLSEINNLKVKLASLETLSAAQRVNLSQFGSKESDRPGSPEEIKRLADEDVKAMGGKVTKDGKYIL